MTSQTKQVRLNMNNNAISATSRLRTLLSLSLLIALLFLSLSIMYSPTLTSSAQQPYTSAKAMCVMEAGSKRVLYHKNSDEKLAMASTTKIMTAITAIENCDDLDKPFTVSNKAIGVPGTSIYLRSGETFTLRDLLYGLMLVSGNDASVAIGEAVGGNVANFVDMMNNTAKKIGAKSTHFDNTHGLDSKTHHTTAHDLALITSYAMQNPVFKEVVSTKNIKITNTDGKTRYLKNKNKLLFSMEGCDGVKTGFTDDAGRCLVTSCTRDGMTIVAVVLNCGPMFEDCQALTEMAFNDYNLVDLTSFYSFGDSMPVLGGRQERVKIGTTGSYLYPLRDDELAKVHCKVKLDEFVDAPVEKGRVVGEVRIFIDNDLHFTEKIYTMENVRRNSIWEKFFDLVEQW